MEGDRIRSWLSIMCQAMPMSPLDRCQHLGGEETVGPEEMERDLLQTKQL